MNEDLPSPVQLSGIVPAGPATDSAWLYRDAFENSTDCLALYDLCEDGRLRFAEANPAWAWLLGRPRNELLGRSLEELLPTEIARKITADGHSCVATEAPVNGEGKFNLPIGRRHFLHSLIPLHNSAGSTKRFLHIVRDITASKRYELQLHSDKQAFRTLAEHTPDTIVRYDRNCLRIYANPAFARLAGLPVAALLGKKPSHYSNHPELRAYEATLLGVVHSGQAREHILTWQNPSGRLYISHIHFVPERTADGEVATVLAVGRDITEQRQSKEALQIREQEFRTLVENSPDVIIRFNHEGQRIYCNPAYERLFDIQPHEVIGTTMPQRSHLSKKLADRVHEEVLDILRKGIPTTIEISWTKANGEEVSQHVRGVPEFDQHGQAIGVLAIARDISGLKTAERRLEEAEAMAHLGHLRMDFRLNKLTLSAEFCRLFGKPRSWSPRLEEVISILAPEERSQIIERTRWAYANRIEELELDYCIDSGQRRLHLHSYLHIEYSEDGTPLQLLGTAQDVSELRVYQQRLHSLAFYDTLTGLPNRELFNDRLHQALAQADRHGGQLAVMILDLDNFKMVNDTLGHSAGDELLRETAKRLQSSVRNSDTVARLGGDEFALILSGPASDADLGEISCKLLQAISGAYWIKGRELFVSGSIGIARYPSDGENITELQQYADSAMYHAKEQGRNNFQFYLPQFTQQTTDRLALTASLRHAQHNGELELYYQPQIDLSNGRLIGAEALLRWNHPQQGLVTPDRFIPIAEETGLIIGIGEWVLHSACRSAAAWNRDAQDTLKVAVNLSPRQFKMNDLPASLRTILQATGCAPDWLELEITEGLLLDNSITVRESLEQLRAMGLSIAIDDFGTGYSALGYLKRFPVETLKIDRSFISDIDHNSDSAELVKAIISMAHSLRLKLVAEGVEESSQEVILKNYGCHNAQGYLYGKPMPQKAFEHLLLTKSIGRGCLPEQG
ncbi:EAL domain-containing protein [Aquipseudomonas alcaligenes]|nr:EAL domain-containing protein [Pseudomonas alcaligenes]